MIERINRFISILFLCLFVTACADEKTDANSDQEDTTAVVSEPIAQNPVEMSDGELIYNANCLACHDAGPGHPGTMRLAIRLGEEKSVLTERNDLSADYIKVIVRQGIMLMPPFRPAEISDNELEALVSYLVKK
jgi:cytochrome c5